jgi:hypothetical protein
MLIILTTTRRPPEAVAADADHPHGVSDAEDY